MFFQESCRDKVIAAGMTHRRPKLHRLGHMTIDGLRLDSSAGIELAPIPFRNATRRTLDTTTQTALVCSVLFLVRIVGVALHPLDRLDVNRILTALPFLPSGPCGRVVSFAAW